MFCFATQTSRFLTLRRLPHKADQILNKFILVRLKWRQITWQPRWVTSFSYWLSYHSTELRHVFLLFCHDFELKAKTSQKTNKQTYDCLIILHQRCVTLLRLRCFWYYLVITNITEVKFKHKSGSFSSNFLRGHVRKQPHLRIFTIWQLAHLHFTSERERERGIRGGRERHREREREGERMHHCVTNREDQTGDDALLSLPLCWVYSGIISLHKDQMRVMLWIYIVRSSRE